MGQGIDERALADIAAQQDKNTKQLINLAQTIYKQARMRVSTAKLNQVIRAAIVNNPPSSPTAKRMKIYYGTQVATEPPTVVLKCNHPDQIDLSWQRYLLGVMREELPFKEVPIKLYLRPRGEKIGSSLSLEEVGDVAEIETEEGLPEGDFDE